MILKYLNNDNLEQAREQLRKLPTLNEKGFITVENSNRWPSLSWQPLITALEEYVENYDAWDSSQCTKHWCQQVGGAQLILPAHVINEYSHPNRPNGFKGCKWGSNDEGILPRTGVIDWKTVNNGEYILGRDFAWARGEWRRARVVVGQRGQRAAKLDVRAVAELMKARVEHARMLLSNKLTIGHPTP